MHAPEGGSATALGILATSLALRLPAYELKWLSEELSRRAQEKGREEPEGTSERAPEHTRRPGRAAEERDPSGPVRRVLLVEDHAMFRQALAVVLDQEPDLRVVGQAASLSEGVAKASGGFDVAVVDLSMPDGDGADLVARLRAINPQALVIALSRRAERERHFRAFNAGASKVVRKSDSLEDLFGAMRDLPGGTLVFLPVGTHAQRT
jgi:CheY-like chemotaxis protein